MEIFFGKEREFLIRIAAITEDFCSLGNASKANYGFSEKKGFLHSHPYAEPRTSRFQHFLFAGRSRWNLLFLFLSSLRLGLARADEDENSERRKWMERRSFVFLLTFDSKPFTWQFFIGQSPSESRSMKNRRCSGRFFTSISLYFFSLFHRLSWKNISRCALTDVKGKSR